MTAVTSKVGMTKRQVMPINHANLPASVDKAKLPIAYENAKTALANCERIDECKDWADKAEALASYARQADDDSLRKQADRIQARAIRRCGELLKQFDRRPDNGKKQKEGTHLLVSRTIAAKEAGLSAHQQKTAVRVANVPANDFENQIESDKPPTVTKLAEQGTKKREPLIDLKGRDPKEFNRSLHFAAMFERYAREVAEGDLTILLPGLVDSEKQRIRKSIAAIDAMHDQIITRI